MSFSSYSSYNQYRKCCCKGDKGDKGDTGPSIIIPYQSGSPQLNLDQFLVQDEHIHYVAFFAPSTGTYTQAKIYTTFDSSNAYTGTMGCAIYDSTSQEGGIPQTRLGSINESYTAVDLQNKFKTLTFSPGIDLSANTLYWFAVAADHSLGTLTLGFHLDYNIFFNLCYYKNTGGYIGSFPLTAPLTGVSEFAFWFRIS